MNEKNYLNYKLSLRERFFFLFIFELCSTIIAHFFYDSIYPVIFFNLFLRKFFKTVAIFLHKKRNSKIRMEFLDFIMALSASLNTGYSFENAILETQSTIENLYGTSSIMLEEINLMKKKLLLNIPVENIFDNFSNRMGIEEITSFSEIVKISKKSGGDMISIIKSTAFVLREKIELKEEIETIVSSRKFEQLIMYLMPFVIFIYIDLTQHGFFSPLYHNITGIIVSTFCLIIYMCSILISKKILEIEV